MAPRRTDPVKTVSLRSLLTLLACLLVAGFLIPTPAEAGPRYRGVQLHSLWESGSDSDMARELDLAAQAGANVVRVDVGWSSLETGGKGQYSQWYVEKLDRFVAGADARGMKVIATLWGSPCWATSAPVSMTQGCQGDWWTRGVTMYPPRDPADYADAARFVTHRYGTKLAALEVWNEPNLDEDRFWIGVAEPLQYAALLKATYPAAKAGNPEVPVLAGALAWTNPAFVTGMYAAGAKGSYDGLSMHPYQGPYSVINGWDGMAWIRGLRAAAGDSTPIWVTEFGWSTCNSGHRNCVSEEQQAEYLAQGFAELDKMPDVEAAVAYNLRAKGTDPGSFEDNFGLVARDFTPKAAYGALTRALGGQSVVAPRQQRLRLRLLKRGRAVLAVVSGPSRARVSLRVFSCRSARSRRFNVHTDRRGLGRRRLGSRRRLSGCRVSAALPGARAARSQIRFR